MNRNLLSGIFLFIITLLSYGQEQKCTYRSLVSGKFSEAKYPLLSLDFEYYSFTDTPDSIILSENGTKARIKTGNNRVSANNLKLHFIPLSADTLKFLPFIQKLSTKESDEMTSDLVVFTDPAFKTVKLTEWIKTKLPGIGADDTILFRKLAKEVVTAFHRPEDVIILMTGKVDETLAASIAEILNKEPGDTKPFVILLCQEGKSKRSLPVFPLDENVKIGVLQFDPEKSNPAIIFPMISQLARNSGTIEWETSDPLNMSRSRNIKLTVNGLSRQVTVFLPDSVINKYFTRSSVLTADSLLKLKNYAGSVKFLNDRYTTLKSCEFINKTESALISFAGDLLLNKNQTPYSSFLTVEETNRLPLSINYIQQKQKYIKDFYTLVDKSDINHAERLKIAEYLNQTAPEEKENTFNLHWSEAKVADNEKNYWKALDEYKLAFGIRNDERTVPAVERLINICLTDAYNKKEWKKIQQYGSAFGDFFNNSFTLRAIYSRSCYEIADYQSAIPQFEWLVFNWKENSELTWEDAFNFLLLAYTQSMRFDDAVILCQRIFREKKNPESLQMALMNLRLKWLRSAVDAFNVWLETVPVQNQIDGSVNLARISLPQYISSINVCDKEGSILAKLFVSRQLSNNDGKLPVSVQPGTFLLTGNNYQLLAGRSLNGRIVVFQLDNSLSDQQEKILLGEVNKEPVNNQVWKQLFQYEEKSGMKLFSQTLAALAGSSKINNGSGNAGAEKYWSAIESNKCFIYIADQRKDGSAMFQKGFDRKKSTISEEVFRKSLKTTSYFQMDTRYGNAEIVDITNPVFGKSGWEGTLRIGIQKQY